MSEAFTAAQSAVNQVSEAMSALRASSSVIDAIESLKTAMAKDRHLFTSSNTSNSQGSRQLENENRHHHHLPATPADLVGVPIHRRNDTFSEGYHRAHATDYEVQHESAAGGTLKSEHAADVELATGERARHTERRHFGGQMNLGVASTAVARADTAMDHGEGDTGDSSCGRPKTKRNRNDDTRSQIFDHSHAQAAIRERELMAQRARERRRKRRKEREEPLDGLGDSILVASPIGMRTAWAFSEMQDSRSEAQRLPSAAENSLRHMLSAGFKGNAARFKKAMANHDGDADGRVTHDEFIRVLMQLGTRLNPGEHEVLMRTFDPEGQGTIDYHKATDLIYMTDGTYREKLKARSVKKVLDKIQYKYGLDNLSTMFTSLDDNKDGSVSYDELRRGLGNLGLQLSNP